MGYATARRRQAQSSGAKTAVIAIAAVAILAAAVLVILPEDFFGKPVLKDSDKVKPEGDKTSVGTGGTTTTTTQGAETATETGTAIEQYAWVELYLDCYLVTRVERWNPITGTTVTETRSNLRNVQLVPKGSTVAPELAGERLSATYSLNVQGWATVKHAQSASELATIYVDMYEVNPQSNAVFNASQTLDVEALGGMANDLGFTVSVSLTKQFCSEARIGPWAGTGVTRREFRFDISLKFQVNGQDVELVPVNPGTPKQPGLVWWRDTAGDHYEMAWI